MSQHHPSPAAPAAPAAHAAQVAQAAYRAQAASSLVSCLHLSKWYGKVVGINDFSVVIQRGVTGLLGPNGAGKSTFIKLLAGALRPSAGQLHVLGQQVWGNRALLPRLGYCPEHDGLYDDLTGSEFVSFMGRLSGMTTADAARRAGEMLERLGLEAADRERPVGEYSKGMRQRVKLAQALVHDPEMLLLDEPLTGCDPVARVQITGLIKELGEQGKGVIVSSHILHEVEAMTSEILLVYRGQVLAEGNIYSIREMIDAHPHKIRVECDDARALGQQLVTSEHVRSLSFTDDGALEIETAAPDACYPLIPRVALDRGLKIRALTSPDNNLQAVFEYLTESRGPEGVA